MHVIEDFCLIARLVRLCPWREVLLRFFGQIQLFISSKRERSLWKNQPTAEPQTLPRCFIKRPCIDGNNLIADLFPHPAALRSSKDEPQPASRLLSPNLPIIL